MCHWQTYPFLIQKGNIIEKGLDSIKKLKTWNQYK